MRLFSFKILFLIFCEIAISQNRIKKQEIDFAFGEFFMEVETESGAIYNIVMQVLNYGETLIFYEIVEGRRNLRFVDVRGQQIKVSDGWDYLDSVITFYAFVQRNIFNEKVLKAYYIKDFVQIINEYPIYWYEIFDVYIGDIEYGVTVWMRRGILDNLFIDQYNKVEGHYQTWTIVNVIKRRIKNKNFFSKK